MLITDIKVTNFCGIKSMDLRDLTTTTFLTGTNGASKTTLLNALRVAFIGRCFDAEGKRVPNDEFVGANGKFALAETRIVHNGKVCNLTCKVKGSAITLTAVDDKSYECFPDTKGATAIREALYDWLGVTPEYMEIALNPRAYLLGPDLGDMLGKLCCDSVTMSDILEDAGDHADFVRDFADEQDIPLNGESLTALGDAAYKARTAVKKSIAQAEGVLAPIADVEQPKGKADKPLDAPSLKPLEKTLKTLQAQRDALIGERAITENSDAESITARHAELEAKIAKNRAKFAEDSKALQRNPKSLKEAQKIHDEFISIDKEMEGYVESAERKREATIKFINAVKSEGDNCPYCAQSIPEDVRAAMLAPLEKELAAIEKGLEKRRADLESTTRDEENAACLVLYISEIDKANEEIATLPDPFKIRTVDEINADIEAIQARCDSGEALIENLTKWTTAESVRAELETRKDDLEHLEWMVAAFRNGEFMKSRLAEGKGGFVGKCNAVLTPYGYTLDVVVSGKDVTVTLQKDGGPAVRMASCSKAELVLAGWAVATAMCPGTPICVDDLDALWAKNKGLFLEGLKVAPPKTPLFVCGAWSLSDTNIDPIRAYLPETTVVWVDGGEAKTEVKEAAA